MARRRRSPLVAGQNPVVYRGGWPAAVRYDPTYTTHVYSPPPPGTFDPGITAGVRKGRRGLQDLLEKEEREAKRGQQDVEQRNRELRLGLRQGSQDIALSRGYAEADYGRRAGDLGIDFKRDIQDLNTARLRGEEDYSRTLTDMQHRYGSAAEQQMQNAIQQGSNEAGTTAASGAVRAANQAHDKSGVDLIHQRDLANWDLRQGRLGEDFQRSLARAGEGLGRQETAFDVRGNRLGADTRRKLAAVAHASMRSEQDRATRTSQAKREQALYESDAAEQAFFQAHQLHPGIQFPASQPAHGTAGPGPGGGRAPHLGAVVPASGGPGSRTNYGHWPPRWPRRRVPVRY